MSVLLRVSIGSSGMGPVLVDNSTFNIAGHNITFGKLQVTVGSGSVFRPTSQVDAGSLAEQLTLIHLSTR